MYAKSLAVGLASFLLGASATPVVSRGPGPVSIWNLTTFTGQDCDGTLIHSFQGSGPSSCDVLTGSVPSPLLTRSTGSVLARTSVGTYDFSFFPDEVCEDTGILERIYQVEGESCISLGDLNPESFNVTLVERPLSLPILFPSVPDSVLMPVWVKARQGPLDTWGASTFTSSDCSGTAITNVGGDDSTTCNEVPTFESCCPVTRAGLTCDCIIDISIGSLLVSSDEGTHSFTIFPGDDTCSPTGVNNPITSVSVGETLCVVLDGGEGSYLVATE